MSSSKVCYIVKGSESFIVLCVMSCGNVKVLGIMFKRRCMFEDGSEVKT